MKILVHFEASHVENDRVAWTVLMEDIRTGTVEWSPVERAYTFLADDDGGQSYMPDELRTIADFVEAQTRSDRGMDAAQRKALTEQLGVEKSE